MTIQRYCEITGLNPKHLIDMLGPDYQNIIQNYHE